MGEEKEQLPLDAKLLSLAVIELNISRRNVAIYPDNHPSIQRSIAEAFSHLQELFELRNEITLAIAKDTLIIDESYLDKKNPVYREFATSLYKMGIASLSFLSGISEEEIKKFHQLITTDPKVIDQSGGIEKMMADAGISHIRPTFIDYAAFHFVEGRREVSKEDINIWENYVYGLLEGKLLTEEQLEHMRGVPPEVFAQIANDTMSGNEDGETYERVITSYLHRSADESRLKKGALGNVMAFIEGLKPSLKKQFLSGTFRNLSPDPAGTEKLAGELSSEQLMGVLNQINEQDEIIPDTLKNLLEKFSKVRQDTITLDSRLLGAGDAVIDDIQLSPQVVKLFEKDRYQDFVTDAYKGQLKNLMEARFDTEVDDSLREILGECNEENMDSYLSGLLIEFFEAGILTEEEALTYTERFIEYTNMFLQTGRFDELNTIYNSLQEEGARGKYAEATQKVLDYMKSEAFLEALMASYRFWGRKNREQVIKFSKKLKEYLIAPLMDSLIEEDNASIRSFYLSLLSELGEGVIPLAREWLKDTRWFVLRNMLYLLRECGDLRVLKDIKPFCEHNDLRVAMEAIKAYLHFNSSDGFRYIKQHLQSKNIDVRNQAVKMIGAYRVKLLVPDLLKLLIRKDLLGGDHHLKVPIVRALGEVGDERAIRYLLEICKTKSLLYKGSLDSLKVEIFRSLKNYPAPALVPLVEEGLKTKNDEIIKLCEQYRETIINESRQ